MNDPVWQKIDPEQGSGGVLSDDGEQPGVPALPVRHGSAKGVAGGVRIPDNPPERTYTCPGCKKAVKATRIGESCSYLVEHLKEEKPKKGEEEGGGKCKYTGPVDVK